MPRPDLRTVGITVHYASPHMRPYDVGTVDLSPGERFILKADGWFMGVTHWTLSGPADAYVWEMHCGGERVALPIEDVRYGMLDSTVHALRWVVCRHPSSLSFSLSLAERGSEE
jgi:hypothetical protein